MPDKINMIAGQYTAMGYESITVSTAAIGFTFGTFFTSTKHARRALVTVEDAQIRYRYDGTDPTSSEGHILNPMDVLTLTGLTNIRNFKAIRKGTTDAKLRVTFEED